MQGCAPVAHRIKSTSESRATMFGLETRTSTSEPFLLLRLRDRVQSGLMRTRACEAARRWVYHSTHTHDFVLLPVQQRTHVRPWTRQF